MNTRHAVETTPVDQDLVAAYDVGGTKVDVLVFDTHANQIMFEKRYVSGDFPSLEELLVQSFRDVGARPATIQLAMAGPRRRNGDIKMTNQPTWPVFKVDETAKRLGIKIRTVNDMVATAAGLSTLIFDKQQVIEFGAPDPNGPKLVIAVSTGVGAALLLPDGTVVPSEGGHATWQPMTPLEERYLKFLRNRTGTDTITVEVAASGSRGFENLYDFLAKEGRRPFKLFSRRYMPGWSLSREVRRSRRAHQDIGRIITHGAMAGSLFCRQAMELLGSILGQHTRNLAVVGMSTGGIFFTGGVMQDDGVAAYLVRRTSFLRRMIGKGDRQPRAAEHWRDLQVMPVCVVTDNGVAVKGALELAKRTH
jgi:glucokinase